MVEEAQKVGYVVHQDGYEDEWQKIRRIERELNQSTKLLEVQSQGDMDEKAKFENS